jgi:hypothetical protein
MATFTRGDGGNPQKASVSMSGLWIEFCSYQNYMEVSEYLKLFLYNYFKFAMLMNTVLIKANSGRDFASNQSMTNSFH